MERSQEQRFDDQLRQSLGEVKPNSRPGSWEQLSSKLEENSQIFDRRIRDSLSPLGESLSPKGWETLEQQIDLQRTQAADQLVQERLDDAALASQPSGWAYLAAHLELIAYRRQSLAAIKITEFCLALSLLLLFWRFVPVGNSPEELVVAPIVAEHYSSDTVESLPLVNEEFENLQLADVSLEEDDINGVNAPEPTIWIAEQLPLATTDVASVKNYPQDKEEAGSSQLTKSETIFESVVDGATGRLAVALNGSTAPTDHPLLTNSLIPAHRDLRRPNPAVGMLTIKEKNPFQTHLRVFYSPVDLNQVITPENAFFNRAIQRDNRLTYGTSAGVLVDITSNRYTVQTGLIYGLRSYIPTVLKITESEPLPSPIAVNRSGYSRLEFHTVSVPVTFNRTLVDDGRWRITAGAGVGLNMILSSSFTKIAGADQILNDLLNGGGQQARGGFQDRVDAREYFNPEPGWFQGGSIFSNANFYLIGTASFERRLSSRLSIFAAPTINRYFHFVKKGGVGPNYDRIHNHSIQIGARLRLGAEK